MNADILWTIDGVRPEARVTAREAAKRAGMPIGDWLNSAILAQADLADLRCALQDITAAGRNQVEDDLAALREMMAQAASGESVKDLTDQIRTLSDKVEQIQQIYSSHIAASETAPLSAAAGGAQFIAAARRAARSPSHETDGPLIANARTDDATMNSTRPKKLMRGIKLLLATASVIAITMGSIELMGDVIVKNFWLHVFGTTEPLAAPNRTQAKDMQEIGLANEERPASRNLPHSTTPEVSQDQGQENAGVAFQTTREVTARERLQNPSHGGADVFAPAVLPASGNLFGQTNPSPANLLIHGTPSLFDPLAMTPDSTPQGGSMVILPARAAHIASIPARTVAQSEELPPSIGGERLRQAATAGDPAALYTVGQRYVEGHGVPVDLEKAARWFERAANKGLVPAEFRYASMLERGQGVKKDLGQARRFYLAAAEKGNAKSMHNLAVLYAQGIDGKPDYGKAVTWFHKAADHGIADSQYNLAVLTQRGLGIETNLVESYKWFALAAAQGDREAAKRRNEIAEELDQQQLAAAQALVKAFVVKAQPKQALVVPAPAGGWDKENEAQPSQNKDLINPPLVLGAFNIGIR